VICIKLNNVELLFPSKPEDILLKQYIPFKRMYDKVNKIKESVNEDEVNEAHNIFLEEAECIVQSLYLFIDSDLIDLYDIPVRDENNKGLAELYEKLLIIMASYKPLESCKENYTFRFKEIDYTIKGIHKSSNKDLSLIESIEILEAQRIASTYPKDKSDDAIYSSMLTTLAVLSRKENERFPTNQLDINNLISSRSIELAEIPYTIALDAAFFLTFILQS